MKKKIIITTITIALVLLSICLYLSNKLNSKLNKINYSASAEGSIKINEKVVDDINLEKYTNIALFGIDTRDNNMENSNSDAIIILSLDNENKTAKMISVYRDTFLDVGDGNYLKGNAAYLLGGPEQAISMLNENLDLNIKNYLTVDFNALSEVVDAIGGITLELTEEEVGYVNGYCVETAEVTGKSYSPISPEVKGTYTLNGVQAVSYSRIRYTEGDDFKRTERQRDVIELIVEKVRNISPNVMLDIMDKVFPLIKTNFTEKEIISLGVSILPYSLEESMGFPFTLTGANIEDHGSCVVATTLASNVRELQKRLFNNEEYTISPEVEAKSNEIENILNSSY